LAIGKAGNHRTQTLRAFSHAEIDAILSKVPQTFLLRVNRLTSARAALRALAKTLLL